MRFQRRNPFRNRRQMLTWFGIIGGAVLVAKIYRSYERGDRMQGRVKPIDREHK